MRTSRTTMAATMLAIFAATTAHAQAPASATPKAAALVVINSDTEALNAATQAKLAERIEANFEEVSLKEFAAFVSEKAGIEIYINQRAITAAEGADESPITVQLKLVRVDMLLELALQQVGGGQIDYVIRDGLVVITSSESLNDASEVRAYPVSDLLKLHTAPAKPAAPRDPFGGVPAIPPPPQPLAPPAGAGDESGIAANPQTPANVQQLISVLHNTVSPDSWSELGGNGTITYYGEMLVIRQSPRIHREINKVLSMLRETVVKNSASK
ncbi:MAG TPA: hypothetical protein VL096_14690 [Pirellulaceae bacterium]|nr:hypothetical protein [Pirellulaceae bacterium]